MKLNHKSVTFATLKEELQEKRRLLDNTTMIIIQGDERSTHGQVVQIMDIARQVGVVDQVIATEPQRN
jgi:biopolymer transport protein ExbD